mgnify:CR=1 FL=1
MTTETEFLIIDVADLPPKMHGGGSPKSAWTLTFMKLPKGKALFKKIKSSGTHSSLVKQFPDRRIYSKNDAKRQGFWYWWEPKTENGSKP